MDIVTLAQVVTSVTNLLFVLVLAAGYYFTWRVSQTTLQEMRSQRTAMGRPLVIVQEDYESLPELDVAIRNVSEGAARDVEFQFSAPIESSNGFVVSDLHPPREAQGHGRPRKRRRENGTEQRRRLGPNPGPRPTHTGKHLEGIRLQASGKVES